MMVIVARRRWEVVNRTHGVFMAREDEETILEWEEPRVINPRLKTFSSRSRYEIEGRHGIMLP